MKNPTLLSQLTATPHERPCDARWDEMIGDDRVRHCASCARDVYDVSAMSPREAEIRLLNSGHAVPCIRYGRRADGTVEHLPEPRTPMRPNARASLAAAAALGVTISAQPVYAKDKKAPDSCVAFVQQADIDKQNAEMVAAAKPADEALPGTKAFAEKPDNQPAAPPPERPPIRLGGSPPPPRHPPQIGTLVMTSKVKRAVTIVGVVLVAPFSDYLLTPGEFVADVRDPDGKTRAVKFKIKRDKTTRVDLDEKK